MIGSCNDGELLVYERQLAGKAVPAMDGTAHYVLVPARGVLPAPVVPAGTNVVIGGFCNPDPNEARYGVKGTHSCRANFAASMARAHWRMGTMTMTMTMTRRVDCASPVRLVGLSQCRMAMGRSVTKFVSRPFGCSHGTGTPALA